MKSTRTYILRLAISSAILIGFYLLYRWVRPPHPFDPYSKFFWAFFALWSLHLTIQILNIIFFLLASRRGALPWVQAIHGLGFPRFLWSIYRRRILGEGRLALIIVIIGSTLFVIVLLLARANTLDALELGLVDTHRIWDATVPACKIFNLITGDNNSTRFLQDVVVLARTLKTLGARLVIVAQPPGTVVRPRDPALFDTLRGMGVLMFREEPIKFGQEEVQPLAGVDIIADYSFITPDRRVIRYFPLRTWPNVAIIDAGLSAVMAYRGFPDTVRPIYTEGNITVGDIRIPVTTSGEAFALFRGYQQSFLSVRALHKEWTDTLRLLTNPRNSIAFSLPFVDTENIFNGAEVRGRIVYIAWYNLGENPSTRALERSLAYVSIIENILQGSHMQHLDGWHHLITLVVLFIAAIVAVRLRPVIAVLVILIIGLALAGLGFWLFQTHLVWMRLAYPVAASIFSALVLPLARFMHYHP